MKKTEVRMWKKENTCEAEERENNVGSSSSSVRIHYFNECENKCDTMMMICKFLSNFLCLLFVSTIVLCLSTSLAYAEFASVNEILVPGQSSVYDVSFNSHNEDDTKGMHSSQE